MRSRDAVLAEDIRSTAWPLTDDPGSYDPLIDLVGDARFVLLGEASHGTHEFYRERADITKRLIQERGVTAVAVEADWPDAARVSRYVLGGSDDRSPDEALAGFARFPTWMWRNTVMVEFVQWLRRYNDRLPAGTQKVGFYGLDLYSMYASMEAVVRYLDGIDVEAAARARARYACFEHVAPDAQRYGWAAASAVEESCEDEVVEQLLDLRGSAERYARADGRVAEDELFHAEQNARLAANAERYYREMYRGRVSSWNLRDTHMAETLDRLHAHLERYAPARIAVWEHNSHIGDARATQLGDAGELNVGQLARERYGDDTRLIGFTTFAGAVTAASEWGGPAERKTVRPGLPGSYERLFHEVREPAFILPLREERSETGELRERRIPVRELREPRLQRAIGVVYHPETERVSHYFRTVLPDQFDAVIHIDDTRAVEPLEREPLWEAPEPPETYPTTL